METSNKASFLRRTWLLGFSILGLAFILSNCSKEKKPIPLLPLALTGQETSSSSGNGDSKPVDSNGITLPPDNSGNQTTTVANTFTSTSSDASDKGANTATNTSTATNTVVNTNTNTDTNANTSTSTTTNPPPVEKRQEVATHGSALITGKVTPVIDGKVICTNPPTNTIPVGCVAESGSALDLTKVVAKLIQNIDGKEVVVASTNLDANGNYLFNIPDLNNGAYRVLINSGDGLNFSYQDFSFVHDPTATDSTKVALSDMNAERLYYTSGAAVISGTVNTPGFTGDVTIASGSLEGVTVKLKDKDGNVIATAVTDANGKYNFTFGAASDSGTNQLKQNLDNGNYTIVVDGSSKTAQGQTFANTELPFTFSFSGNDPAVATNVTAPNASLNWNAATTSSAKVSINVANAAIPNDTTTQYTLTIKNSSGIVIAQQSRTGAGSIEISGSGVPAGVYTIEVTGANGAAAYSSSINFIPHSSGGVKEVDLGKATVAPKPSNVTGTIQGAGGSPNPVPGAVVNFRPDGSQPPSSLAYLALAPGDDANTVRLRNIANLWMREACSAIDTCKSVCEAGGYQTACVIQNQGTSGSWTYNTYANKVYEVNGTQLFFQAVAGKWSYYISAPGYANTDPAIMVLNGQDVTVAPITMSTSDKRSQIKGNVAVIDTLSNGTSSTSTSVTGLFAVMLGNTDSSGKPVAHVAVTANGAFNYNGDSKVVSLANVPDVDGNGVVDDTDRVKYAIGAYSSAPKLSAAATVSGAGTTNSVDSTGGFYNFKQSSYQVIIADPMGYILTTPKQADNSAVATNTYTDGSAMLNLSNIPVLHQARRSISGTVTDAISTGVISGATVTLGTFDSNNVFQQNVRRDCLGSANEPANSTSCTLPANRLVIGSDQVVPSVTTGSNGAYTINNVAPGSYVLKVSQNGIDTYFPVTVTTTGNVVVNAQVVTSAGRGNLTGSVKTPSAGGNLVNFTGVYNLEILHPNFGTRPTAGIQPASLTTGSTQFTNTPNYNVFSINAGSWKVRFVSSGYVTVEALVNIQANATTTLDIVAMVPGYHPPAAISGRALSAMTNQGVSGLTVRIRSGVNVTSGSYVGGAVTTAADGSYAITNVPAGDYTLEVTGADYITSYRTVVSAGPDTPKNQDIVVSPKLEVGEMRIVVTWGAKPADIDSHMEYGNSTCKTASGKKCQAVWNDRCHLGSGTCNNGAGAGNPTYDLALDVDDTTSYGPETITAKGSFWNGSVTRRGYSLYNWSNEATMGVSGSKVIVFKGPETAGGNGSLVRTFVVDPNLTNRWWQIFCIDSNKNIIDAGKTGCETASFFNASQN